MKIKIIKCSNNYYWYHNRIGEIFDVSEEIKLCYLIRTNDIPNQILVFKEDCVDYTFQSLVREIINEENS